MVPAAGARTHGPALSPRNANYAIEVALDPEARTLAGRQRVVWTNPGRREADELRFHLYWNAWSHTRTTWMLEDRLRTGKRKRISEEDASWIDVRNIRLVGRDGRPDADLTRAARFARPDDGDPDDRTVLVVALPEPVEPGASVAVDMTWESKIPRTFARTGFRGDYFFIAQWFPKLGVFQDDGWNCHPFHATTEFFADYGVYDVRITVPEPFVVGATGREIQRRSGGGGTVTYRFRQEDVHDFAWTASPEFLVREARFEKAGLPPVDLRLLVRPEHLDQVERHFAAAGAALEHYGTWYGAYPYGHLTLVDPAWDSRSGGMEYPTLVTCGTRVLAPFGGDSPESVTVHEVGHQFWYGLVGNNEFEDAWLDEGLNTFSTLRTLDAVFGPRKLVRRHLEPPGGGAGFFPRLVDDVPVSRWHDRRDRYRRSATADVPGRPSFLYFPPAAGDLTYSKTALWLATLERYLGWDTLREILSTFFERHAFGHPTPEDFFAVASEVSGRDLDWFFDQVYRGSEVFDYAVDSAVSFPAAVKGFVGEGDERRYVEPGAEADDDERRRYRTEVVVRRLGGGTFPVDVLLVFEDGEQVRESWDGKDRWRKIVVERASRLDWAEVDPGRILLLDPDLTNNSRLREPAPVLPAAKWGAKWMVWLQDLLATLEYFP